MEYNKNKSHQKGEQNKSKFSRSNHRIKESLKKENLFPDIS